MKPNIHTSFLFSITWNTYGLKFELTTKSFKQSPEVGSFSHCSNLNIYTSPKIRLSLVDLEGQVQVNFLTKPIILFIWKFKSKMLIFALFFAGVVKSSTFCTLLMLFPIVEIHELQCDAKMWLNWFILFVSLSSCEIF